MGLCRCRYTCWCLRRKWEMELYAHHCIANIRNKMPIQNPLWTHLARWADDITTGHAQARKVQGYGVGVENRQIQLFASFARRLLHGHQPNVRDKLVALISKSTHPTLPPPYCSTTHIHPTTPAKAPAMIKSYTTGRESFGMVP